MTLIEVLRRDQIQARKTRETPSDVVRATLLTTLLGEAVAVGKNQGNRDTTDEEVLKVMGKFLAGARETARQLQAAGRGSEVSLLECDILEKYLAQYAPKPLSEEELEAAVRAIAQELGATSAKDMGRVMAQLKARHAGAYDGAKASAVCKRVLA